MEEREAIHLACAFDLKVPEARKLEVMRLLSSVNEQLWIGHFDLWSSEGVVMYRQALLLSGGAEPNTSQVERLLVTAIEACERYFQAFQFVVWAGKTAPRRSKACCSRPSAKRRAAALLGRSQRQIEYYLKRGPIPRVVALACFGYEALAERQRSEAA